MPGLGGQGAYNLAILWVMQRLLGDAAAVALIHALCTCRVLNRFLEQMYRSLGNPYSTVPQMHVINVRSMPEQGL